MFLKVVAMLPFGLFGVGGAFMVLLGMAALLLASTLIAFVTPPCLLMVLLVLRALSLLGLEAALLLGPLVQCRGQVLQRGDQMDAQVSLGFMSLLD